MNLYFKKLTILKCLTPSRNFFLTSYNLTLQHTSVLSLLFIHCLFRVLIFIKIQNFIINRFSSLYNNIFQVFIIFFQIFLLNINFQNCIDKKIIKNLKLFTKFFNITNKFIFHKLFYKLQTKNNKNSILESYNIINNNNKKYKKNLIGQTYFIELYVYIIYYRI